MAKPYVRRFTKVGPSLWRVDSPHSTSFSLQLRRHGVLYQPHFPATTYGGIGAAHAAAKKARAEMLARFGPARPGARARIHTGPVRSTSGVRGVHQHNLGWYAVWYEPRGVKQRIYTGRGEAAKQKAIRLRTAAEKRIRRSLGKA